VNVKENTTIIKHTCRAFADGTGSLDNFPGLLRRVLTENMWREFLHPNGEVIRYERFTDFVTAGPPAGVGTTVGMVRKVVSDDLELLDLLDQAVRNPHGGDRRSDDAINVDNVNVGPTGNAKDQALRRLRKDAPELNTDVLAGLLSPHGAMVKAGLRPRTFTVRADDAASIARTLTRQLEPEVLNLLRKELEATQ